MKKFHEMQKAFSHQLPPCAPVLVELKVNAFELNRERWHLEKPYDEDFHKAMVKCAKEVFSYYHTAKLAYVHNEEINLLVMNDVDKPPFLSNRIDKISSIVSSKATAALTDAMYECGLHPEPAVLFSCKAYVVPPSQLVEYFCWKQYMTLVNTVNALSEEYGIEGESTKEKMDKLRDISPINTHPNTQTRGEIILKNKWGVEVIQPELFRHEPGILKSL